MIRSAKIMWPFSRKAPKTPSHPIDKHAAACDAAFALAYELEAASTPITDDEIRKTYWSLASIMQSNCDSVARGKFVVIASLCAHRQHLVADFLPSAMEPLYLLDVEDMEVISKYLTWLAGYNDAYLGRPTASGRDYLLTLAESPDILREAFRQMYEQQESRNKFPVPRILEPGSHQRSGMT